MPTSFSPRLLRYILLLGLLLTAVLPAQAAAEGIQIAVLAGKDSAPSQQMLEGFTRQLGMHLPDATITQYSFDKDNDEIIKTIPAGNPALLLTVGSSATRFALSAFPNIPLVASLILDAELLQQATNATGVFLTFPAKVQLQWLRRFSPSADQVSILYNPEENASRIEDFRKAAGELNMTIDELAVPSATELPAALKELERRGDILLAVPDKTIYSGKTAKAVLLSTYRNRIPFAGLSASWVKAGALYALEWDYADLGRQCAVLAEKILSGTAAANIAPQPPDRVLYVVNLKTVNHLRLDLDQNMLSEAAKTYK